jgi:hypothetical protein
VTRVQILRIAASVLLLLGTLLFCSWLAVTIRVDHWGFAISVNFLFMACFTLIFSVLHTPAYSSDYFEARSFERGGRLYRRFGVHHYQTLLRVIGWEKLTRGDRAIAGDLRSLEDFEYANKGSELIHTLAAMFVAVITIWIGWRYSPDHTRWLIPANVLLNVYPVLLQRYNRPRVHQLIRRKRRLLDVG